MLAVAAGTQLGLLTVLRVLQVGFLAILGRPFDPIFDWSQLGSGVRLLEDSMGPVGAVGTTIGAAVAGAALVVLMGLSVRRPENVAARHRTITIRTVTVLTAAWTSRSSTSRPPRTRSVAPRARTC